MSFDADNHYPAVQQGAGGGAPRRLAAGRGWGWIKAAFVLVREQPLTWVLLLLAFFVIQIVVGMVPLLGQPLVFLLSPVFAGGLVLAAHKARRGGTLELADLFAGFRAPLRSLLGVGLAYMAITLLALFVLVVLMMVTVGTTAMSQMHGVEGMEQMPLGPVLVLGVLASVVMLFVNMCYWFAPALVVLEGREPLAAIRGSLTASLANWGAFLLMATAMSALFLLALLPLGLGLLLWFPVMYVTGYTAWREVFGPGE